MCDKIDKTCTLGLITDATAHEVQFKNDKGQVIHRLTYPSGEHCSNFLLKGDLLYCAYTSFTDPTHNSVRVYDALDFGVAPTPLLDITATLIDPVTPGFIW